MTVTESPSHLAGAIRRIAHKDNTQHMGDLIGRPYTESPLFWVRDIWQRFDWKNFNRNGYTTLRAFVVKIPGASPIIPVEETNLNIQTLKQQAGIYAAQFVESGMVIGLGTGSTAIFATRRIAQRIQSGELRDIIAIPTSLATESDAQRLGIPLSTLEHHPRINLTIDGADEVDPDFNVIKGGGGALLREKIVAQATERLVIVVDESKHSDQLGTTWAVPVEVFPFGWHAQAGYLRDLGAAPALRMDGDQPYATDQGNIILDSDFGPIADPAALATTLNTRAGIAEHGLFINMARDVIVAGADGVRHLR